MKKESFYFKWLLARLMNMSYTGIVLILMVLFVASVGAEEKVATGRKNLIPNGNAEETGDKNRPAHWSLMARKGKAILSQTADDKIEGKFAAQIKTEPGRGIFEVRIGGLYVPAKKENVLYKFSGKIKAEFHPSTNVASYFAIGSGKYMKTIRFPMNKGWQTVEAKIVVPAGKQLRRLELIISQYAQATFKLDDMKLVKTGSGTKPPVEKSTAVSAEKSNNKSAAGDTKDEKVTAKASK